MAHYTEIQTLDRMVKEEKHGRTIPVLFYLPLRHTATLRVILFSHGMGGNRYGSSFLGKHWAKRGYASIFLQHPGSDEDVWKSRPRGARMAAMQAAVNRENFILRMQDAKTVMDQLEVWNNTIDHPLYERLDSQHIGMSGHSFGAVTTQALSGQLLAGYGSKTRDSRIIAAISMSPSLPKSQLEPEKTFAGVTLPWLVMTGTQDDSPLGRASAHERQKVYDALPAGDKYQLILYNAEHSVFIETVLPGDKQPRNPNHHRVIQAMSTAFWDAYLKKDLMAKAWLNSHEPYTIMEKQDIWQQK